VEQEKRSRADAIAARAAVADRQRVAERARAQLLIDEFIAAMHERGAAPVRLRSRVPGRRATYRTRHFGWYIRANRSLAVSVDGAFYVLDTRPSLRSRLFGVEIAGSEPPLVVGRGARDGESIELADLLRRTLLE
jgi:hypothetical protein